MAGAEFVRADLHVHLIQDGQTEPTASATDYVQAAIDNGISILGVTDHNSTRWVEAVIKAAKGRRLLVLPGIEITAHDGHLIALFGPDDLETLSGFADPRNLDLGGPLADGSRRSSRSLIHLVNEIGAKDGLAVLAHVDAEMGIQSVVRRTELADLLKHPALAGLEFRDVRNLRAWFTNEDGDDARREAWQARQGIEELAERGLARVMSSDAHDRSLVGKDGTNRPLTRLRVGDLTYTAARNALLNNPKARCKVEAELPATYPHLLGASFEGGFLDGVTLDFATNLNCLIGGRGSGKSTALLAIRAALGAERGEGEDDPDDPVRMPQRTTVRFVDRAGTERTAVRERADVPRDIDGLPVELALADLGQGESGQVASSYRTRPAEMLTYLDQFCHLDKELDAERDVLDRLTDNAAEVRRTSFRAEDHKQAEDERKKLEANIKAAQTGKLDDIAKWAIRLATQATLIAQIRSQLERVTAARATSKMRDLPSMAVETGTDLTQRPIAGIADPLGRALLALNTELQIADRTHTASIRMATTRLAALLGQWDAEHERFETRRLERQQDLEAKGLRVQADEIGQMGKRFEALSGRLAEMLEKRRQHQAALKEREKLLNDLRECRRLVYERRRGTLRLVTKRANDSALDLIVTVSYRHEGIRRLWREWVGPRFGFKADRLMRLGIAMRPWEFAACVACGDLDPIVNLVDVRGDGRPFFNTDDIAGIATLGWDERFELETMRLEDLPRIDVRDADHGVPREFDHLSAGQQRSVLLSLLLCADRSDPLIIDQPEDHLDAPYIATGVVRHLEEAKERRQIIIATHNANLTVLGDAELVVPLYAENGKGTVRDLGAVDHPLTLRHVCRLLEGGATAYARRGRRYGFEFKRIPGDL